MIEIDEKTEMTPSPLYNIIISGGDAYKVKYIINKWGFKDIHSLLVFFLSFLNDVECPKDKSIWIKVEGGDWIGREVSPELLNKAPCFLRD